jgi:uncharacterized membrane protein (DUF4010 family)
MFFRVIVEVAVVNPNLLPLLLVPMLSMGVVGGLSALFFWFSGRLNGGEQIEKEAMKLQSPFSLIPAIKIALLFALILFVTKFANDYMGDRGVYLTSVVSGFVDVDAITLSLANLAKNGLAQSSAVVAITLATIVNTLVKGAVFLILGGRKAGLKVAGAFVFIGVVGAGTLLFI